MAVGNKRLMTYQAIPRKKRGVRKPMIARTIPAMPPMATKAIVAISKPMIMGRE